jgi:hypothetical protein
VNLDSLETTSVLNGIGAGHAPAERRMRRRFQVRWPLSILNGKREAGALSTVTENLSSRGFCCLVDEPLPAGNSLACILTLPLRLDPQIFPAFRCEAHVVWVQAMEDGRFSIGCRIEDYSVAG